MYHNGFPVYADVRRDTHLMDPDSLRERITERTKAVIVTNLWGLCADYDAINAIAREHDLVVIEDCAHAIYATYKGAYAGCNGDIGVYSFQMSKQMALGDAGMVVCKSEEHRRVMEEMTTFGTIPKRSPSASAGTTASMRWWPPSVESSSSARAATWTTASRPPTCTRRRSKAASG
jgi:dTDP-4-amino-4,6-dideoxygalactose transaminase